MKEIRANYEQLRSSLPTGVTLIAVSKTRSAAEVMELYNAGHRDFGENYVQELLDKQQQLPRDIRWHFIGHLQSNKVKFVAPFVQLIHGVDSLRLLKEINKQAVKAGRIIPVLLQVHIAEEETKFGLDANELMELLQDPGLHGLANIRVEGLMGMATFTNNRQQISNEFGKMTELFQMAKEYNAENINIHELSIGMSADYQLALEHGSTMIRVGTAIFGEREYR